MRDLEKKFGFKISNLNKLQHSLLKKYVSNKNEINSKEALSNQLKSSVLNDINNFYNSLDQKQQIAVKDWLTYEICAIDQNLIPSLKISEFVTENNLQNNFAISSDGKSYFLAADSYANADLICSKFQNKYQHASYEIIEVK